ncbi:hypothetical protein C8D87_12111 [Lentzea atacamensis]|uniref:Uncharacterized protein n=1 Tax=Lentzea atacamensis TaxID=531938 RepID=A0ABX9DUD5_9PSEU|nr:hypothetical protein [Lentzea atacamensis]RAS57828.1 hypothetical protein C8D87_12111 [Lentzea atacamensis]
MSTNAKAREPDDEDAKVAEQFAKITADLADLRGAPLDEDEFADRLMIAPVDKPRATELVPVAESVPPAVPNRIPATAAVAHEPLADVMPQLARPTRPPLIEPTPPQKPNLGKVDETGHAASLTGYTMSVAVGAFGQIVFLGTWLQDTSLGMWGWAVAALGAAFSEVSMIGAGNSSLTKRRDGGRWKLLLTVACGVCFAAVAMQVTHWLPISFGIALVFGLASFVGFLIHMVIEHSKIRDYEDLMARYETELAAYQAEVHERYLEDLAEYEAALAIRQRQVEAQQRHELELRCPPGEPELPSAPKARPRPQPPVRPAASNTASVDKDVAIDLGVENKATTPSELIAVLNEHGHPTPPKSTVKRWTREIRAKLNA